MIKIIQIILLIANIVIIISCENSTEPENEKDINDIYEIVLRDKFMNNSSGYDSKNDEIIKIYFIGLYEEIDSNYDFKGSLIDPEEDLIKKFNGYRKEIKKVSQSQTEGNWGNYQIKDNETNEKGMIFILGPIKRITDNEIEIEAGYCLGPFPNECETYRLKKEGHIWQISYKKYRWIT